MVEEFLPTTEEIRKNGGRKWSQSNLRLSVTGPNKHIIALGIQPEFFASDGIMQASTIDIN